MSAHRNYFILKYAEETKNELGRAPLGTKARCVTPVAKRILLDGRYYSEHADDYLIPMAKSIGAGVYEVWLEKDNEVKA